MTTETTINWEEYITEFLSSGMTIRNFAKYKECSEHAFKYHLYKDPRYEGKSMMPKGINLIPVMVDVPRSETVRINGFDIDISSTTWEDALAKVLGAIRRIS
jgi:hypothetical protein